MDYYKAFNEILAGATEIALATSAGNIPNVRIVSICNDESRPGVVYFQSKGKSRKVDEFAQNSAVAFTTCPFAAATGGSKITNIRCNSAVVVKSKHSFMELAELFCAKVPEYREIYMANADVLEVFELHVKEALVVVDYGNYGFVTF